MNKKTEAKCNGAMLTVGFHGGTPPLIWRFDLERNHSFTLSLQGEEGDWELGVTTPRGDFHPVVHFAEREDAELALLKVEKTLSKRRGSRSVLATSLMITAVLASLIILGVVGALYSLEHEAMSPSSSAMVHTVPKMQVPNDDGIPLPADEVLKAPH